MAGRWVEHVVERLLELLGRDHGRVEGPSPAAVGQRQRSHAPQVVDRGLHPPLEPGQRGGGAAQRQVGAQALGPHLEREARGCDHDLVGQGRRPAGRRRRRLPVGRAGGGAGVEREPPPHRLHPLVDVVGRADLHAQPEAVEQLRPQLALLGVHGAHQHEVRRVPVGDAVALHQVLAGHRHVEQHVDQVVGQEVDLVDVEHATVGGGEQARLEADLATGEGGVRVERADHTVLGRTERQLHERRPAEPGCQAPGERRLGRALLAAQQHAADARVGGGQAQSQLGVVLADDGVERERRAHRRSSQPSASSTASVSVLRATSDASHSSRSAASSSRSAMARSAHGFDASKNDRISGSPT